jgi:protein-S-isoprenylcysteine O-methyltransferase Ste14
MDNPPPPPGGAYGVVERLHLRQWALRAVVPLAALATNGAGLLDVAWLPRSPSVPPAAEHALRGTGLALVVVSATLRVAAKGVLVRKTTLTTGGVYGAVRHPFYLANLLGALGTFLVAGPLGAAVGAAWIVVAAPIYAATIAGEEKALARLYPAEFSEYAAHVRALLPGRPPPRRPATRVTWANLRAEREPPRLLRFLAGAVFVSGLTTAGPAAAVAIAAAAAAFGISHVLR